MILEPIVNFLFFEHDPYREFSTNCCSAKTVEPSLTAGWCKKTLQFVSQGSRAGELAPPPVSCGSLHYLTSFRQLLSSAFCPLIVVLLLCNPLLRHLSCLTRCCKKGLAQTPLVDLFGRSLVARPSWCYACSTGKILSFHMRHKARVRAAQHTL